MQSFPLGSKLPLLVGSLLLLPQLALAAPNPLVGTYELTGRQGRRGTTVELKIEETSRGGLKFTRKGKFTGSRFASVPEFTWTKTGLYHGRTAYALYYVRDSTTSGMAGALAAGSSRASRSNVLFATYRLSANGKRAWILVNRRPPRFESAASPGAQRFPSQGHDPRVAGR